MRFFSLSIDTKRCLCIDADLSVPFNACLFHAFNRRPSGIKERRMKLPDLIVSGLSEKQLRCKLKEHGLSAKGDKKVS